MNVTQLSVFMENKPGTLSKIVNLLGENHINITTLTIAETPDFGILRMLVNDTDRARRILKENSFTTAETQVLAIELPDQPGALARALEIIAQKGLNVEYMYAYAQARGDRAVMIFRFDDIDTARKELSEGGFRIVRKSDITGE